MPTDPAPARTTSRPAGRRPAVTFTLDLEDHRPDADHEERHPAMTRLVLDRLEARGVRGTVFVVGEVAERHPDLVRRVAARHEVALHGWRHVPLTELDPDTFRAEVRRGRALLRELSGQDVVGFRAPTYSLVPSTVWATDVLAEEGFTYSSSVLPAANPLFGFPGAPAMPFRWPSGLLELPSPTAGVGPLRVPHLGGVYLRALPGPALRWALRRDPGTTVPFTYVHPYDPDVGEPFWWVPDAGRLAPLLWAGRRRALDRVEAVLGDEPGPPLVERVADLGALPTFDPATPSFVPVAPPGATTPVAGRQFDQQGMVHLLPKAPVVDRIAHLVERARGLDVVHVGFVDAGCQDLQARSGAWLHEHLAGSARRLVGLDVDAEGVAAARALGYEAHVADVRDASAVAALGLERADLVIAGEVIEHLDDPGTFLDGLHALVRDDGSLVVTTPNANGLLNVLAGLAGREVNHPDHVVMFTWRTLTNLLDRHGWQTVASSTYLPAVKRPAARGWRPALATLGGRAMVAAERVVAATLNPFAADGLIVEARPRR